MNARAASDASQRELANRLRMHVDRLAGLIGPRHLGRPATMAAAIAVIEREFMALGDRVRHETYDADGQPATNLIVKRRGDDRPEEIIILGAHYDTVPETPGADDNASAVAVLIETARRLIDVPTRRTIRFIAFANEEPPHFFTETMGSQVHAKNCHARGENIIGMLCLEMVGYYTDEPNSQRTPNELSGWLRWLFPRRGNFLTAVGNMASCGLCWSFRRGFKRASRFPLFSIVLPERVTSIRLSDNSSFWDYRYPALMLTDTSFLRNPHYHQPGDTPETLDYDRMADVTMGVAGAVAHLAGGRLA